MVAIAHLIAILCYVGAAALAAAPFVRPVSAPIRGVTTVLALGIAAHIVALSVFARSIGAVPLTGLGPALSFSGVVLALTLLVVEVWAREVSLTLVAAPFAALPTTAAVLIGLEPAFDPTGTAGTWLVAHIALSFLGIAAFATSAAAGAMYLVERKELKSRRFGAVFRFFPPLDTLDRVNHVAAIAGWVGLTLGIILAAGYSVAYKRLEVPEIVWGVGAWIGVTAIALGRVLGGWQARRAAIASSLTFAAVVALYVAFRVAVTQPGRFL